MRRNPAIGVGMLIAIGLATTWCFGVMMSRRFAGGEVYPPCSTQRVDPMGAKALYEALDRLAGTTCERNFKRMGKLSEVSASEDSAIAASRQGQTLVLLDLDPWAFDDGDAIDGNAVRDFAIAGGRVVLTVNGATTAFQRVRQSAEERERELEEERREEKKEAAKKKAAEKTKEAEAKSNPPEKAPKTDTRKNDTEKEKSSTDDDTIETPFKPTMSLVKALGIGVKHESLREYPEDGHELKTPEGISPIGGKLPRWLSRSSLDLDPKKTNGGKDEKDAETDKDTTESKSSEVTGKESWQVLATVEDKPVLAQRRFGRGSVVVASDSYFATNQALTYHPVPEFLAWLMGDARHVIFDETHLGTQENPGIMTLARRYRLHGFFLGGVLLFALFVWQSSSSLVPATDGAEPTRRSVAGQGAVAGLVSLLRRGVSRARLLQTCFDQWVRNHPHPSPALQARIEQARALLPPGDKRPPRGMLVSLYQRLCETLHPNRR
jgi:hypothetical protein